MPETPETLREFYQSALPAAEQTDNSETESEPDRAMSPPTTTDNANPDNNPKDEELKKNAKESGDPPSAIVSSSKSIPIPPTTDRPETNDEPAMTRGTLRHDPHVTQTGYVAVSSPSTTTGTGASTPSSDEQTQEQVSSINSQIKISETAAAKPTNDAAMEYDDDSNIEQLSQVDPDGTMPFHRSSRSRRFDDTDTEILLDGEDVDDEKANDSLEPTGSLSGSPVISALKTFDEKKDQDDQQIMSPLGSPGVMSEENSLEGEETPLPTENLQQKHPVELKPKMNLSSLEHDSEQIEPEYSKEIKPEIQLGTGQIQVQFPVDYTRQDYLRSGEYHHDRSDISVMSAHSHSVMHGSMLDNMFLESDRSVMSVHSIPPTISSSSRQPQVEASPLRVSSHAPSNAQPIPTMHQPSDRLTPVLLPTLHQRVPLSSIPPMPNPAATHPLPPQQLSVPVPAHTNGYHHQQFAMQTMPPSSIMMSVGGKRKIHLRLIEDVMPQSKKGLFLFKRRSSRGILSSPAGKQEVADDQPKPVGRGNVTVSWYEGTTSLELLEHVRNSVTRKLGLQGNIHLSDLRILDETTNPPEGKHLNV